MSKECNIIFREKDSTQDIIIICSLDNSGDLTFKTVFDPPVDKNTKLDSLAGQLCVAFCDFLIKK